MSSINSHIISYLDDYINPNTSSEFAVLLTGSWGSGKTWFIQQYISDLNKVDPVVAEYPFLLRRIYGFFSWFERQKITNMGKAQNIQSPKSFYISLYGAKSISDIEERMVISIAHKIDTGFFSLQSKYLYGVISEIANGFKRVRLSKLLPVSYFLQKSLARSILIFDDLERCDIDCNDLFGFINSFLEQENLKVILIANEGRIDNERKKKYDLIKEKLVGKTFVVASEFDAIYNNFVDIIENQGAKQTLLLEQNKNLIFNLFQEYTKSKKHTEIEQTPKNRTIKTPKNHENNLIDKSINLNLRTLRQIILDFEKIFKSLPEIAENKAGLLENILKTLTIFSIETRAGEISTSDISKLEQLPVSLVANSMLDKNSSKIANANLDPLVKFAKKWSEVIPFFNCLPSLKWWQDFFENGFIDQEYLNQSILASQNFSTTPNWLKLIKYRDLSDQEFNQTLLDVESDYSNRKYEEIEIVKHITGFLLWLNKLKFYAKSREKILKESIDYIDYLKTKSNVFTNYINRNDSYQPDYFSLESEEFKSLCNYIDKVMQDLKEENWSNIAKELLDTMQKNYKEFKAVMTGNAYLNEEGVALENYHDTPVFIYIDPCEFVTQLLTMVNSQQERVLYMMENRYHTIYKEKLKPELEWLKSVQELIIIESNKRKQERKISGFLLSSFTERLGTVIEQFNSHTEG
jgi:KAP family P-loop domain